MSWSESTSESTKQLMQSNFICPNGEVASRDTEPYIMNPTFNPVKKTRYMNTISCKPIICPTGYELTPDSQGTLGCAEPGKEPKICPPGSNLDPSAGLDTCRKNNLLFRYVNSTAVITTDDGNYKFATDCPPNYIRDPAAKKYGYIDPLANACKLAPFECPSTDAAQSSLAFTEDTYIPYCSVSYNETQFDIMCPSGFKYSIDSTDMVTCTQISNYSNNDSGNCPVGYGSEADKNGNPNCIYGSSGTFRYNSKILNSEPSSSNQTLSVDEVELPPSNSNQTLSVDEVQAVSLPSSESTNTSNIKCPVGSKYLLTETNGSTLCLSDIQSIVNIQCPTGFSYNGSTPEGGMSCVPIQGFTSHVYEFKSKRSRTVETFSQNSNGKCKARY